jgi:hypothetical protein
MPSLEFKQNIHSITVDEDPVELIEFHHSSLSQPMRFVRDNRDFYSLGFLYSRCPSMTYSLPQNGGIANPTSQLTLNYVGYEVSKALEDTLGAKDGNIVIKYCLRSRPDIIEYSYVFDIETASMSENGSVVFSLNYNNLYNKKTTPFSYRPNTAEGLA